MHLEDEEHHKWFCNGGSEFGFVGGCKGNQTDFGFHETMSGWQCPDLDNCDFDLCEMCIRWILHCQRENQPLGIITPD